MTELLPIGDPMSSTPDPDPEAVAAFMQMVLGRQFTRPEYANYDAASVLLTSAWIQTPLGPMLAVAHDEGLVMLDFVDRVGLESALLGLRKRFGPVGGPILASVIEGSHRFLTEVKDELDAYFTGSRLTFKTPIAPAGSDFEQKAWAYLRDIPPGETRTYGQQAAAIGSPGASRAAGKANGNNFLALLIPCHRVIGAAGKLTGYGGGLHRKAWLLEHEQHAAMQLAARGQSL